MRGKRRVQGSSSTAMDQVISIIIPTYNEAKALPGALDHLQAEEGDFEIIVSDGGSSDGTCELAKARSAIRVVTGAKGRACQMNAGARLAQGEWLLFLHADTRLPEGILRTLARDCEDRGLQAAGFRHRFSGDGRLLRFISWLHNTRCRITGILYGDQGLVIQSRLFWNLGAYPDVSILEDVIFGERLRRVARPALLPRCVITDSRKFEQRGVAKSLGHVLLILACHQLGLPIRPRSFFDDVR